MRVGFRVICGCVCMSICIYIYKRERERERERQIHLEPDLHIRVYDFKSRLGCMDGNAEQE